MIHRKWGVTPVEKFQTDYGALRVGKGNRLVSDAHLRASGIFSHVTIFVNRAFELLFFATDSSAESTAATAKRTILEYPLKREWN